MRKKRVAIIGSGFSGIAAAAYAAQAGHEVHVFEKNSTPGGRARQFTTDEGYVFDMGPSWYWMPDIIENFFADFQAHSGDYYQLVPLNPQFDMVFAQNTVSIPEKYEELRVLFESIEQGAAAQLDAFMKEAQYKYEVGMRDFVNKPCHSWLEFMHPTIARSAFKLDLLTSFSKHVRRFFKNQQLITLMEFPVLFLGASPSDIPALYSLMNYGGLKLGTWYPMGGFIKIIEGMKDIAEKQGATFHFNAAVTHMNTAQNRVTTLTVNGDVLPFDAVIASSDYHHTESQLLPAEYKNYSEAYWEKKVFAPSCLIYYLGVKEKIPALQHHTLFFENDLAQHAKEIYEHKQWPSQPLFYVCCPSKTDPHVAPENHENIFLLMPVAPGIEDNAATRERYLHEMIARIEKHTGAEKLTDKINYKRSYCINDFVKDYNAYKGNAYGLANTLRQTAVLKPAMRNKKLHNLFYTGQLTVPGPGVPPSLISGKIAATEVSKLKNQKYEKAF